VVAGLCAAGSAAAGTKDKVPITTSSEEARKAYLEGRDLSEKLRATDAHGRFEQAAAKDPSFALAYLGMANTSATAKEFFPALDKAVALADKVSEGERLEIQAAEAGAKNDPARQHDLLEKLVAKYPGDERAHFLLGQYDFGRTDFAQCIAELEKSAALDPRFSQPLNLLGYAYRAVEKYDKAEKTFKKYIELIPNDPNPYDSYAELLMKMGRYEDSIKSYEKALAIDPNFVASYIGIGNDHIFMGRGDDARKDFAKLTTVARNDGERRQALFWTAVSYVHEGATDQAVAAIDKEKAIAEAAKDLAAISADLNTQGNILLEAGRADDALAKFKAQIETLDRADVPDAVKEAARRGFVYHEARIALLRGDVATAKSKLDAYAKAVAVKKVPFEVWLEHELRGVIALAEKQFPVAAAELEKANQQDPRILYLLATAYQGKGDAAKARTLAGKAASWNALGINYGYVRAKAKELAGKS
jgi:tetratricopeptide (TPR) repeat protein